MKFEFNITKGTAVLAGILATYITGSYFKKKKNKKETQKDLDSKIQAAVDGLATVTEVEVSDYILEQAAKKAAEKACEDAAKQIEKDFHKEIQKSVKESYLKIRNDLETEVKAEFMREYTAADIMDEVENRVAKAAYLDLKKQIEKYNSSLFSTASNGSGVNISLF